MVYLLLFPGSKTTKITKETQTEQGVKIEIDAKALKKVLTNPMYKDFPVAVYSVIGPFRSGKSFLLSCWTLFAQCKIVS